MFSHEQLISILSTLPDPAFILSRSGKYAALFGGIDDRYYHDGSSLVGQNIFDVLNFDKASWFAEHIALALDRKGLHVVEYTLASSDIKGLETSGPDHPIWFEGRIQALDFLVDGEEAVVWVASNMTEKNAIQQRLRTLSETDPLTGLVNRRKLLEELHGHFAFFQREQVPTAALMFDVDKFKDINDVHGHQVGDSVLTEIAQVCLGGLREADCAARIGGDEFVLLMPGVTIDDAEAIANLMRHRIALRLEDRLGIRVTISGGVSEFVHSDQSSENIIKRADDGLYESKRRGRNRISAIHAGYQQARAVATHVGA